TPGVVWMRSMRSPLLALLPLAREPRAGPLVVSVIPPPCIRANAHMCARIPWHGVCLSERRGRLLWPRPGPGCAPRSVGGGDGNGQGRSGLPVPAVLRGRRLLPQLAQLGDGRLEVL